jgi:hypothetical protein
MTSGGYVRPIAWRGSEVMGVSAIGASVHLAIAPWAQEGRLSVQAKPGGIAVTMAKYRRPAPDVAPGAAKVAGLYIICGIEKDRALKAGFDDALMLDWQGRLAESTGANVFGHGRQAGDAGSRTSSTASPAPVGMAGGAGRSGVPCPTSSRGRESSVRHRGPRSCRSAIDRLPGQADDAHADGRLPGAGAQPVRGFGRSATSPPNRLGRT